jgi:hypothetical protein
VSQDDIAHNTHTQADTLYRGIGRIRAIETIEDVNELAFVHAYPLVFYVEFILIAIQLQLHTDTPPLRGIFNGIADQMKRQLS